MPNPYPTALRARAVHAYEAGTEAYAVVAARFELGVATLQRWVRRQRTTGVVDPLAKGGGWTSPVDRALLQQLVDARPDQTTGELTRAYNQRASPPAELDRARVQDERAAFHAWAAVVDARRLVFLDESGANLAMGRSHAWLPRG